MGMLLLELPYQGNEDRCHKELAASDGDRPCQFLSRRNFLLRLGQKLFHFLCAAAEEDALARQCDPSARALEKTHTKLRLQLGQLTGKRRLRHVETLRCLCDISLSGGRQKIMNHTHVHDFLLPVKGRLDN